MSTKTTLYKTVLLIAASPDRKRRIGVIPESASLPEEASGSPPAQPLPSTSTSAATAGLSNATMSKVASNVENQVGFCSIKVSVTHSVSVVVTYLIPQSCSQSYYHSKSNSNRVSHTVGDTVTGSHSQRHCNCHRHTVAYSNAMTHSHRQLVIKTFNHCVIQQEKQPLSDSLLFQSIYSHSHRLTYVAPATVTWSKTQ